VNSGKTAGDLIHTLGNLSHLATTGAHADGGLIVGPGSSKSDNILTPTSPGEFVIQASAVNKFGKGFFENLNRGIAPGRADGGFIGSSFTAGSTSRASDMGFGQMSAILPKHTLAMDVMSPSLMPHTKAMNSLTPALIENSAAIKSSASGSSKGGGAGKWLNILGTVAQIGLMAYGAGAFKGLGGVKPPAPLPSGGAHPGNIGHLASGGFVSGDGDSTSDSIPGNLSNGEFVMRASSVSKYGRGFFENLNSGVVPRNTKSLQGGMPRLPAIGNNNNRGGTSVINITLSSHSSPRSRREYMEMLAPAIHGAMERYS
jgi:hypothetical protein